MRDREGCGAHENLLQGKEGREGFCGARKVGEALVFEILVKERKKVIFTPFKGPK